MVHGLIGIKCQKKLPLVIDWMKQAKATTGERSICDRCVMIVLNIIKITRVIVRTRDNDDSLRSLFIHPVSGV